MPRRDVPEGADREAWLAGRCCAKTTLAGKCDRCGKRPQRDADGVLVRHHGRCLEPGCDGTMRCMRLRGRYKRCKIHMRNANPLKCRLWGTPTKSGVPWGYGGVLRGDTAKLYERVARDPDKLNTEAELTLLRTQLVDLLRKQNPAKIWRDLGVLVGQLGEALEPPRPAGKGRKRPPGADVPAAVKIVGELRRLVVEGVRDSRFREETRTVIRDISRVASREGKRQVDLELMLPVEKGSAMMALLAQATVDSLERLVTNTSDAVRALEAPLEVVNAVVAIVRDEAVKARNAVAREFAEKVGNDTVHRMTKIAAE